MTRKRVALIAAAASWALAVSVTHHKRPWDVFVEDDEMQACDRPVFGRSLVYCLPNAEADSLICDYEVAECKRRFWCTCAWAVPRPKPGYAEEP